MTMLEERPAEPQLRLLEDEPEARERLNTDCCSVSPGQRIVYVGRVGARLRYGDTGVVRQALRNRAVVDMGSAGTWHLPYYVLRDTAHCR